ncbi:tail fiber protein [Hymenobacter sp. M29]|uniref:Tail fiber protein n=1 Tax=Hymenobacter mellowenesis TaxID=3063995 RepID=A0ABT9AI96_9BACT|nr:tail fiber protein [Hymenobacter sp. M29]MDO7849598.1 tail fiber protein [Hymenobacter sp. M29]
MSSAYIGEIRAVGFNFPPVGWATCNGQLLQISEYQVLFTLLGTTYGGDGVTTFGVPNMSGRIGVGAQGGNSGPGLSSYPLGSLGGQENVALTVAQMPAHGHTYSGSLGASNTGTLSDNPSGRRPGVPAGNPAYASTSQAGQNLASNGLTASLAAAGASQAHTNMQPSLALNFIIATDGYYPPQPQ